MESLDELEVLGQPITVRYSIPTPNPSPSPERMLSIFRLLMYLATKKAPRLANVKSLDTLFVGNLPFQTTEEELATYFATCGDITQVRIITDKLGRSRGYGI